MRTICGRSEMASSTYTKCVVEDLMQAMALIGHAWAVPVTSIVIMLIVVALAYFLEELILVSFVELAYHLEEHTLCFDSIPAFGLVPSSWFRFSKTSKPC